MRLSVLLLIGLFIGACSSSTENASVQPASRLDTLSRYTDGAPRVVTKSRGDSVLERRTYRHTGMISRVERGDSVHTYFDLHDPDSAAVLKDYLLGRWRNLSADTSHTQASVFYVFDSDRLTFQNSSRVPLESLNVTYKNNQTLVTEHGMSVRAEITSFDTVQVTGYTLVRRPPPDST